MIDNNVDQDEWTNSSVSLDRIVKLEDQFVDDLFQSSSSTGSTRNQDQLCAFVAYGPTRIFQESIFQFR
jgi:hypothetical protein